MALLKCKLALQRVIIKTGGTNLSTLVVVLILVPGTIIEE